MGGTSGSKFPFMVISRMARRDEDLVFTCTAHRPRHSGKALPISKASLPHRLKPSICLDCSLKKKAKWMQTKQVKKVPRKESVVALPTGLRHKPASDAAVPLMRMQHPTFSPSTAVIDGVQEMLNLLSCEVAVLVRTAVDPYLGKYLGTVPALMKRLPAQGSSLAEPSVANSLYIDNFHFLNPHCPAYAVIDAQQNKIVARIYYQHPLLADSIKVAVRTTFSSSNLKDFAARVRRGASHMDTGPMYGYGYRAPIGGKEGQQVFLSHYSKTISNPQEPWNTTVENEILPLYAHAMRCATPGDFRAQQLLAQRCGIPTVGNTYLSTMYMTNRYQSASHVDADEVPTVGYFIKEGTGSVIGNDFIFPAHQIAVPLGDSCVIVWDGKFPHCTSLAQYEGAFYLATVLTTPTRIARAAMKRTKGEELGDDDTELVPLYPPGTKLHEVHPRDT